MDLPKLYGRRKGRPLHKRKAALVEDLLPKIRIILDDKEQLALASLFPDVPTRLELEIGFGSGDHLAGQAERQPAAGFIGCEPFLNGIANLLGLVDEKKLENVRIFPDDARKLLDALPPASLDRAYLLFPDPWPKARHVERRFICPENMARFARAIKPGGELRLATDMPFLAEWMEMHASAHADFQQVYNDREPPVDWVPTRYEEKGRAVGRIPFYLTYRRV